MELRTIEDVEIVSTGTYSLGSGETTFTEAHLADAVRATTDPTIVAPRIKLGHTDTRFADDLDGEPAFGQVANLRLDNNGQTIKGDLVNMPDWLADGLPAHYPGRSIEGGFNFKAPSGNEYGLVISDLALLGTQWPGVTSLSDLQTVLKTNGTVNEPVAAGSGYDLSGGHAERLVSAKLGDPSDPIQAEDEAEIKRLVGKGMTRVAAIAQVEKSTDEKAEKSRLKARLDVGDFRRVFATDLRAGTIPKVDGAAGQEKWWARSVVAAEDGGLSLVIDDADGHLIELPVVVNGDALAYGPPALRQSVAASGDKGQRVLASWPSTGARPQSGGQKMDVDVDVLRKRLGLAEDADETAIGEALTAEPEPVTASGDKPEIPEGMALVDSATLAELRQGAEAGIEVKASLARNERDSEITAAIGKGKFPGARREHYTKLWDADPEGTKALLASLEPGLVPGAELGTSGDGEGAEIQASEDANIKAFEARFFPEMAGAAADGGAS